MSNAFVPVNRDMPYLLPPSIQDWLPDNHLARFVVDIVQQLDLRALTRVYAGRGSKAYHPGMLLSLLFYGYATGVFSSRKLERATYDSVAFRYICANTHPDHDRIATFRKRFLPELKGLFVQILQLAHEMKMLSLGTISLDGTKMKAHASKHSALSWAHARKLERQLRSEVEALLQRAQQADRDEEADGLDIPAELARREARLEAIAKAKAEIERRAAERYAREKQIYDQKLAARAEKQHKTGKKPRGRNPKPPAEGPKNQDQVNLTDDESRIMPTSGGGFDQGYNAQAAVDLHTKLIVATHVTQQPNDKKQLAPALENLAELPTELGTVDTLLADSGYFSEDNVQRCEAQGITPYIATGREAHNLPLEERQRRPPPLPPDADAVTRMQHRLQTPEGRKTYGQRKYTSEPPFGVIKAVMGCRQFLLRGLEAASGEWNLVCLAWNLKRLHVLAA
ncbi:MAG: IS1182 family transposase [Proteobacteria bacterium]|nr:IS1182 family transposase [Pseudomonadota bacterium]